MLPFLSNAYSFRLINVLLFLDADKRSKMGLRNCSEQIKLDESCLDQATINRLKKLT